MLETAASHELRNITTNQLRINSMHVCYLFQNNPEIPCRFRSARKDFQYLTANIYCRRRTSRDIWPHSLCPNSLESAGFSECLGNIRAERTKKLTLDDQDRSPDQVQDFLCLGHNKVKQNPKLSLFMSVVKVKGRRYVRGPAAQMDQPI